MDNTALQIARVACQAPHYLVSHKSDQGSQTAVILLGVPLVNVIDRSFTLDMFTVYSPMIGPS